MPNEWECVYCGLPQHEHGTIPAGEPNIYRWQDYSDEAFRIDLAKLPDNPIFRYMKGFSLGKTRSHMIHYLSDRRHPVFDEDQIKHSQPTTIPAKLQPIYTWYRRWLVFLHRKRLLVVKDEQRIDAHRINRELPMLAYRLTQLIDEERAELKEEKEELESIPELDWIVPFRQIIRNRLHAMKRVAFESRRICLQGNESVFSALLRNWEAVYDEYRRCPLDVRMLCVLLDQEFTWENRLRKRHVEDMYVSKALRLISDKDLSHIGVELETHIRETYAPFLWEGIEQISMNARLSYRFRLLRDWTIGRPWKKLYVVMDGRGRPFLAETIQQMQDKFALSKRASDLFDVHPLDNSSIAEDETCPICCEAFAIDTLLMRTRCNHDFHPECLFRFWDAEEKQDYPCPMCRQSARSLADKYNLGRANERQHPTMSDIEMDAIYSGQILQMQRADPLWPIPEAHAIIQCRTSRRQYEKWDKEKFEGHSKWHRLI
ncbi:MAG: hypothetical protein M1817_002581 [Caeruleum heppii]|nr:MAG: hypothetical protein M1817_002581 [Caeruleum heppii]